MPSQAAMKRIREKEQAFDAQRADRLHSLDDYHAQLQIAGQSLGANLDGMFAYAHNSLVKVPTRIKAEFAPALWMSGMRIAEVVDRDPVRIAGETEVKPAQLTEAIIGGIGARLFLDAQVRAFRQNGFRQEGQRAAIEARVIVPLYQAAAGMCLHYGFPNIWELTDARREFLEANPGVYA